jgi:autotransporter-associated beta strand protein
MVANMRRTAFAGLAMVALALAGVYPALGGPISYVIQGYSFDQMVVGGPFPRPLQDGEMTPYETGLPPPNDTYSFVWNPAANDFSGAGGNGSLPGTATGSQCFVNTGTSSDNPDIGVPLVAADATVASNKRYTMTAAVGSPLTATIMNGMSLTFADTAYQGPISTHEKLFPSGFVQNSGPAFLRSGTFGDISYSLASSDFVNGTSYKVGDGLALAFSAGAGTCWDNVRLISQNWYPLYSKGNFTWDNNNTAAWSTASGGAYTSKWTQVSGRDADAVFEGTTGGTVSVAADGVTANSLSFFNDNTMPSYMLQGGTITLTGDATITSGAGTSNVNNWGGGTNTIASVLAGTAGMYKAGAGKLILTGNNTYTGGTTVGGATLQIGGGGTTGSIQGDVQNLANLAFNRSDTLTFNGNISRTGSVDIVGSGKTIFTGANTYSGLTNVKGGWLQINGASSTMNVLTNASGVNVTGGILLLDYSSNTANESGLVTTVQGALKTAYASGFLSGQIRDTSATANLGLGWVDNATTHQIMIMPALYGDANLDGQVTAADLGRLLANYNGTGTYNWSQGDFTYDGKVTAADLGKLLANFNQSGPIKPLNISLASSVTLDSTELAMLAAHDITVSTVPEPSSLIMLASLAALGAAWGVRRQRNCR